MQENAGPGCIDYNEFNRLGILAGVLILVLPIPGAWWTFSVGTEFFSISLSPFTTEIIALGTTIISPLLFWLNLGLLALMILFGLVILTSSILRGNPDRRETSDWLIRATCRKPLYLVIIFIIAIALVCLMMDQYFSVESGRATLPILHGTTRLSFNQAGILITAPIRMYLTPAFFFAVIVSVVSFMAGVGCEGRDRKIKKSAFVPANRN